MKYRIELTLPSGGYVKDVDEFDRKIRAFFLENQTRFSTVLISLCTDTQAEKTSFVGSRL